MPRIKRDTALWANDADATVLEMPLISPALLGRGLNVGRGMVDSAARKAGVRPTRLPNNRDYLTPQQAIAVTREILLHAAAVE